MVTAMPSPARRRVGDHTAGDDPQARHGQRAEAVEQARADIFGDGGGGGHAREEHTDSDEARHEEVDVADAARDGPAEHVTEDEQEDGAARHAHHEDVGGAKAPQQAATRHHEGGTEQARRTGRTGERGSGGEHGNRE